MSFLALVLFKSNTANIQQHEDKLQERFTLYGVDRSVLAVLYGHLAVTRFEGEYERLHAISILTMKKLISLLLLVFFSLNISAALKPVNYETAKTATIGKAIYLDPIYDVKACNSPFSGDGEIYSIQRDESAHILEQTKSTNEHHIKLKVTPIKKGLYTIIVGIKCSGKITFATYKISAIDVTDIYIPEQLSLQIGDEYTFTPSIFPNGVETNVNYLSSNTNVATIENIKTTGSYGYVTTTNEGLLKAKGIGTTTIKCTASNGVSTQCVVTVSPIYVETITLNQSELEIHTNQTAQLTATVLPVNATDSKIKWTSSDEKVAIVGDNGLITAVSPGYAKITATANDGGGASAVCVLKVNEEEKVNNYIYLKNCKATANSSTALPLYLDNKDEITAVQFDMLLPQGITIGDNITINITDDRATAESHTVAKSVLEDGTIRVICYSPSLAVFEGESGAILNIPINISDDIAKGEHKIQFSNIILTEKGGDKHTIDKYEAVINITDAINGDSNGDGSVDVADIVVIANYILGITPANFIESAADVNGDGTIDVADIVALANLLLHPQEMSTAKYNAARANDVQSGIDALKIMPFTASAGNTSRNVTLDLLNTSEDFTAFQCDLYLPDGITVNKNKRGTAYNITFNTDEDRTDASCHTLNAAEQKDGAVRIICYSVNNDIFAGLDGALVNIPLSIETVMNAGFYNYSIKNVVLTRTDGTKVKPDVYNGTIVIGDGGQEPFVKMYGDYTADNLSDINTALNGNKAILGIDMTDAERVESKDAFETANPNTIVYLPKDCSLGNEYNVVVDGSCGNLKITDAFDFGCQYPFTADNAEYMRAMPIKEDGNATKWGTVMLPFELHSDSHVQYYELANVNDARTNMTFKPVQTVPTGTPAVFCVLDDANTLSVKSTNTEVANSVNIWNIADANWKMKGTFTNIYYNPLDIEHSNENAYYISDESFLYANKEFAVAAFRGWFETPSGNSEKIAKYNICVDEANTGIDPISNKKEVEDVIYNVSGVQISSPVKGEINIINHKKVLVK